MQTMRLTAAGGLVALALAAAGCASATTARNHAAPKLHIGHGTAAALIAPAMGGVSAGQYVLAGDLPTQPTHARVWRWPAGQAVGRGDVARLAAALGITGTPQRHAHGWVVTGPAGEVHVRDGGSESWTYARADLENCPPYMIDVDSNQNVGSGCAMAMPTVAVAPASPGSTVSAPPPPPPPSPGPDDAATVAAAHDLLAGLGISGSQHVLPGGPGVSTLSVSPTLASLPTEGLEISVDVDARGIRSGTGFLAFPKASDDYPLRTAKSAFDDLAKLPRPMIAQYCPAGPAPASCPPPKPMQVTGATLGLALRMDDSSPVLVPAWFFAVAGSSQPIAIVAVDPGYIDEGRLPIDGGGVPGGAPEGVPGGVPVQITPVQSSPSRSPVMRPPAESSPTLPANGAPSAVPPVSPAVSAQ